MSDAYRDPLLRRAIDELRQLPDVDPAAIRDVVAAAATARLSDVGEPDVVAAPRRGRLWRASTIGAVAAAAAAGFMVRGALVSSPPRTTAPTAVATGAPSPTMRFTAADPTAAAPATAVPVMQQFTLENKNARHVAVVGDFNDWDPSAAPMTRAANGGPWSVAVPVTPGRHVYAFMVDDSLFVLDPRAASVRDPDLGTVSSVVLVGRP